MTPLLDDLAGQIKRLLAFMGEISGQAKACWVTLTDNFCGAKIGPAGRRDRFAGRRAYYVIGRTPQILDSLRYVNLYLRYAGAQRLVASGPVLTADDETHLCDAFAHRRGIGFDGLSLVEAGAKHNNSQHFGPEFR